MGAGKRHHGQLMADPGGELTRPWYVPDREDQEPLEPSTETLRERDPPA
jgi:hypothetical protein